MTYSDNNPGNNHLCYAMSDKSLGSWEYKGIYLKPTGIETSHGSVVEFKGQWYALYHCGDISLRGNLRSICIDPVEFNEDGTIKTVVQSRNGRMPAGPAPVTDSRMKIYGVSDSVAGGHAAIYRESNAYEDNAVHNFRENDSYVEFRNVDGFDGGRVTLGLYDACGEPLSKLRLIVNGVDYSLLNFIRTGFANNFAGYASFTLRLQPGAVNTVRLCGGNGEVAIEALSVEPLDAPGNRSYM